MKKMRYFGQAAFCIGLAASITVFCASAVCAQQPPKTKTPAGDLRDTNATSNQGATAESDEGAKERSGASFDGTGPRTGQVPGPKAKTGRPRQDNKPHLGGGPPGMLREPESTQESQSETASSAWINPAWVEELQRLKPIYDRMYDECVRLTREANSFEDPEDREVMLQAIRSKCDPVLDELSRSIKADRDSISRTYNELIRQAETIRDPQEREATIRELQAKYGRYVRPGAKSRE